VSVLIGYIWLVLSAFITRRISMWSMDGAIKRARKTCDEVCANSGSSSQHKQDCKSQVESLEKLKMEMIKDDAIEVTARLKGINHA
jgi:hypothetical protein